MEYHILITLLVVAVVVIFIVIVIVMTSRDGGFELVGSGGCEKRVLDVKVELDEGVCEVRRKAVCARPHNNCLFEAVLRQVRVVGRGGYDLDSIKLRATCDALLMKQGMPLIDAGSPAGEQYLGALSELLDVPLRVKLGDDILDVMFDEGVSRKEPVTLIHVGPSDAGHWLAARE